MRFLHLLIALIFQHSASVFAGGFHLDEIHLNSPIQLLILKRLNCDISFSLFADICPMYIVQPGETLDSISQKLKLDKAILVSAIEGCGRESTILQTGDTICLPGTDLPGCPNVASFNSNPKCKYYPLQPGESVATIANSLNLYRPDVESANPDIIQRNLQVGDLVKLPPWDEAKCGLLPTNIEQLVIRASPPPLSMPTAPPKPNGSKPKSPPSPSAKSPNTYQAPPAQVDAEKCRGFRVRELDDLFSIASLFTVEVPQLVSVNPDLAGGIPVLAGMVVKIPPYDPACSTPVLIDAEALLAPPPMTVVNGLLVGLQPINQGAPTAEGPSAATNREEYLSTDAYLPPAAEDYGDYDGESDAPDVGLGGSDTIDAAEDETYQQNIVKDGGNSNAPPPPKSGSNTGNIIMGVSVFVVCIAVVGIMGMAFSGTGPMKLSMKKDAAPDSGFAV
jgi:hypothetical protein